MKRRIGIGIRVLGDARVSDLLEFSWPNRRKRKPARPKRKPKPEWDKGEHEGCGKDSERAFYNQQFQSAK